MKPEDICISLEQAKWLKELGIKQNTSCFVWVDDHSPNGFPQVMARQYFQCDSREEDNIIADAFTLEELGSIVDAEWTDDIPSSARELADIIIHVARKIRQSDQYFEKGGALFKTHINTLNKRIERYDQHY